MGEAGCREWVKLQVKASVWWVFFNSEDGGWKRDWHPSNSPGEPSCEIGVLPNRPVCTVL